LDRIEELYFLVGIQLFEFLISKGSHMNGSQIQELRIGIVLVRYRDL
jgi:hypothetical protein